MCCTMSFIESLSPPGVSMVINTRDACRRAASWSPSWIYVARMGSTSPSSFNSSTTGPPAGSLALEDGTSRTLATAKKSQEKAKTKPPQVRPKQTASLRDRIVHLALTASNLSQAAMRCGIGRLDRQHGAKFLFGRVHVSGRKFLPALANVRRRRVTCGRGERGTRGSFSRFRTQPADVQLRLDSRQARQRFLIVVQVNRRESVR